MLDNPELMTILADVGDTPEPLALRLRLDQAIRQAATWPGEREYAQIADDLEHLGWLEHAGTLRSLAGTDQLTRDAWERWRDRYQNRGVLVPEPDPHRVAVDGGVEFADTDPVCGVDGALYERGYITEAPFTGYAVAVRGRGFAELIAFGDDEQACERWVASRGPLATAALDAPPAARDTRTWREERLLAAMLTGPAALEVYRDQFPPDTFTADGRYEIYTALRDLAAADPGWYPWQVPGWVTGCQDRLPAEALGSYGGDGVPWLLTYLERLTVTAVAPSAAAGAACAIRAQDFRFRHVAGGEVAGQRAAPPEHQPAVRSTLLRHAGPTREPGMPPGPDIPAGPVPRM